MFKTNVRVQKVYLAIEGLQHQTDTAISPLLERLDCVERSLAQSLLKPDSISHSRTLDSMHQQALVHGTVNKNDVDTIGLGTFELKSKQEPEAKLAQASVPTFRLEKSSCKLSCACSCHTPKRHSKPYLINAILGSMFRGYYVSPLSTDKCDNFYCGNRSVRYTYEYTFPRWFAQRSILIAMVQSTSRGPELCLKTIRLVPATSLIYKAAESGKTYWVRSLLARGQASVLDVDEHGHTPLHVSEIIS